jgi:two-component system CheB/CheR fusion protein
MSEPALLADHLDEQTEAILAVWRSTVEEVGDVPEAERLSHREFLDHVPELLDRLADRLRGRPADAVAEGKKHGEHRWRQGYDIGNIVTELAHLRTALYRATLDYARDRGWDLARLEGAFEAINEVLSEATAESVRQYQDDSRAEMLTALAESKGRQRAAAAAEARARAEQAKLRTILRSLPAAVWVVDPAGTIVDANALAQQMHAAVDPDDAHRFGGSGQGPGQGAESRIRRPDGSAFEPQDEPIRRALRGGTVTQEEVLWQAGGTARTVLVDTAPLLGPDGTIEGAVGIAQDVTERKRHEEELRRQHDLFRTITEAQGEGLCTLDPEGRVAFINPAGERLFGATAAELVGRTLHGTVHFLHPDGASGPTQSSSLAQAIQTDQTVHGDEVFIRRDGRRITLAFIASPIITRGRRVGHVVVLRDVSDRIAQEAELKQQRERAEAASQHKTRLVAALSHDARTPLNAVVLAAQLLELHFDGELEPDPEIQECLRTIRHSVRNVLDLLGDLLNLSKIDAGAVLPEVSAFPLEPVLAECLASIETQARMKGLKIQLDPGNLAGRGLETDRAKLKQIISNFLSNAVRYTEQGMVRLCAELRGGRVRIAVIDTGVGIEAKDQDRIFDEFASLEHPRRSSGEGTGLGLAICRRLAGLLGGEIHLVSAPGQGSIFTLVLPGSLLSEGTAGSAPDAAAPARGPEAGTIVVAEDHDESRQTLGKVLRRMGYRVLEAADGRAALALVASERPFAVLMDVNMPVMDGVEATLALRADPRFRNLPIFALTGDVTPDNQQRIGEAGVNGYLEKPVSWDLLKQALSSIGAPAPE